MQKLFSEWYIAINFKENVYKFTYYWYGKSMEGNPSGLY